MAFLLLAGCSSGNGKAAADRETACETLTLTSVKENILGKDISSLPAFKCYIARDTVLEGDEGVTWKGKAYYYGQKLVFLAETNWENPKKIHRITILEQHIKEGGLFVDQRFKDVRGLVSGQIPSGPNGYLFLTYKKDTAVSIQLDISGVDSTSRLFTGVTDLSTIPDTLRVERIVIM
jgi:hypothetical protein